MAGPLTIRGVTLIDGAGGPPLPDAAVRIEGGRTVEADPSASGLLSVADPLLLAADPLADIRNTRRIERVIARGEVLTPDEILAGLARST